jgi:hypothetical protein
MLRRVRAILFSSSLLLLAAAPAGAAVFLEIEQSSLSVAGGDVFHLNVQVRVTGSESITGLSYFWGVSAAGAGKFSVLAREVGASPFSFLNSTDAEVESPSGFALLNPNSGRDLGGALSDLFSPLSTGSWFVASYTFFVAADTPVGAYILSSGSVAPSYVGAAPDFAEFAFTNTPSVTVNVVPEASAAALVLQALGCCLLRQRRRRE